MNENTTTSDPSTAAALPTAPGSAAGSFGSEGWADTIDKAASMVYQYANLRAMNAGRVQDRLVREMADLMMLRADLLTIRDTLRAQPNAKLSHPAPNLQQPKPMSENLPTSPTPREPGCAPATCSALDFRDGDLAAIRWRDNWDGQGDICECIAVWRRGEWWPNDGGNRLLHVEGSEILHVWPMRLSSALSWDDEPNKHFDNPLNHEKL